MRNRESYAVKSWLQMVIVRMMATGASGVRMSCLLSLVLAGLTICSFRLITLINTDTATKGTSKTVQHSERTHRAAIVDRNNHVLASDIQLFSLAIAPDKLRRAGHQPHIVIANLQAMFPDLDPEMLLRRVQQRDRLFVVKHKVSPTQRRQIDSLGFAGLEWISATSRVYTYGNLLGPVLGYTDADNHGLAGVEKGYEPLLAGQSKPVKLTIDHRLQLILAEQLQAGIDKTRAKSAFAIAMSAHGGEILAMVSLPASNPHHTHNNVIKPYFNFAAQRYEMGSIFKIFNTALALESGITSGDRFSIESKIKISEYEIQDSAYHLGKQLSAEQILVHSSNIGSAKIAMQLGQTRQKAFLEQLGLLDPTGVRLPELSIPQYPYNWGLPETITIAYGYGVAVTPIHITAAVAGIVNGGIYYPPKLVLSADDSALLNRKLQRAVISSETSAVMRRLLAKVVTDGTGRRAIIPGLAIGGKTGTAEKLNDNGKYNPDQLLASFVAVYPIDNPQIIILTSFNEPRNALGNPLNGGQASAQLSAEIIREIAGLIKVANH